MRTLGKLRHEHLAASARASVQAQEQRKVQAQERSVWRRRASWLARLVGIAAIGWFVGALFFAVGRTAEGVVRVESVTVTAPAPVRVARLLCRDGQTVERGQVLALLEPVHDPERDVLTSRLQRSKVRLALVQGGATLDEVDIGRRTESLVAAQLELQRAGNDARRAELEVAGLTRSREALAAALHQDKTRKQGTVAVLQEQLREARARVEQATATLHEKRERAAERQRLAEAGITSGRDLAAALADEQAAAQEVAARQAAVLALEQAKGAASIDRDLEGERATAALAELDAAIATARATAEFASKESAAWRGTAARRDALLPRSSVPTTDLLALEVALLSAEVAEREAELGAHDHRVGRATIRAEHAGVVDRVHASEGAVLDAGQPLLTYFDPRAAWVELYVAPDQERLALGGEVSLVPEGGGKAVAGTVAAIGRILVQAPVSLAAGIAAPTHRFLPVRITTATPLLPNQRVRAVFPLATP